MSGYLETPSPTGNNVWIKNTWGFFIVAGRQGEDITLKFRSIKRIMKTVGLWGVSWSLISPLSAKHLGRQAASRDRLWKCQIIREEHQFIMPHPLLKTPQRFTSHASGLWKMQRKEEQLVSGPERFISGKATSVPSVFGEVITTAVQDLAQCSICAVPSGAKEAQKHFQKVKYWQRQRLIGRDCCGWWGLVVWLNRHIVLQHCTQHCTASAGAGTS